MQARRSAGMESSAQRLMTAQASPRGGAERVETGQEPVEDDDQPSRCLRLGYELDFPAVPVPLDGASCPCGERRQMDKLFALLLTER